MAGQCQYARDRQGESLVARQCEEECRHDVCTSVAAAGVGGTASAVVSER